MTTRRLDGRLTARNPASSWTLGAPTYQVMTDTHENREVWQDVLGAVDHLRSGGATARTSWPKAGNPLTN